MARFQRTQDSAPVDVAQMVTDRIVAALERGTCPWRRPWAALKAAGPPRNGVTNKAYRGVNALLTMATEYSDPRYVSFKQALDLGTAVRKGEKGNVVVFYREYVKTDTMRDEDTGEDLYSVKPIRFLRYSYVFNRAQLDNPEVLPELDRGELPKVAQVHEQAEQVIAAMPNAPKLSYGAEGAYYRPSSDSVHLPSREAFHSTEELYQTAFHELVHATGHESRLNRECIAKLESHSFGSAEYAKEELVAELGASMLMAHVGLDNDSLLENSAAYIASWLEALRNDKRLVLYASAKAEQARRYILGEQD